MATIDNIIDNLNGALSDAMGDAKTMADRIRSTAVTSLRNPDLNYNFTAPDLVVPPDFGSLLPDDTSESTLEFLNANVDALVEKYFPSLNGCFKNNLEDWLCGVLNGTSPLGKSASYFDAAWQQGRDREALIQAEEVSLISTRFSGAGFSLPPGAMANAILRTQTKRADAVSELNRAQVIKDADLKWEMLRTAVDRAAQLKTGLLAVVADMYTKFLAVQGKDVDVMRMKVTAYSAMQDALANYHRVELGFEEIKLRAAVAEAGIDNAANQNIINAANAGDANAALANASRGLADIAAAAANAQSALAIDASGG